MNEISNALRAIASYQEEHADHGYFVHSPYILSEVERSMREAEVLKIARKLRTLADEAEARTIEYDEFDVLRAQFHPLGKLPPGALVSDVARAIVAAELKHWDNLGPHGNA